MSTDSKRHQSIHLSEEEVLNHLPERIGNVLLDYKFYAGKDLYSDGEIEDEILAIVKEHARIEYPAIIEQRRSWPILYHLSALRGNIVDWLPITSKDRVLEIGSGCGAITEKLAEKAGKVTCVELSAKRSQINAYRNQDKDNIEIHVGNFNDIEPSLDADYDYVCLIGVFEYGNAYIHTETPYEDFLRIMCKHVKPNGHIVIAIENKFGLKYWAGCKEDHQGEYFYGLEGYPEGGNARTFTRHGLEKIFRTCGVEEFTFYYPYPDYKFPTTIYSDERLPGMGELTDNLRNFDRDRMVLFNEKYVFDGIIQDEMFDAFSNSYMAILGPSLENIYTKFSNDRMSQYALKTEIVDTPSGRVVRKIPMTTDAIKHIQGLRRSYELLKDRYEGSALAINPCELAEKEEYAQFPFEKGRTLEELMDDCLDKEDMDGFFALFDRYYSLISYGEEKNIADYDLIFANILVDNGQWTVIDYEWTVEKQISSKEIAFRAIYCYVLEEEKRNRIDFDVILNKLGITQQEAEEYREKEQKFQKLVTGKRKSMGEIRAAMGTYAVDPQKLMQKHLQKILEQRIQIYYDYGNGFCEENSEYKPDIYIDERIIETELSLDGTIRGLRIDPADESCMVRVMALRLNGQDIPLQKKYVEANGKLIKPNCYVFTTSDPNMNIKLAQLPLGLSALGEEKKLFVKLEVVRFTKDMAEAVNGAMKMLF